MLRVGVCSAACARRSPAAEPHDAAARSGAGSRMTNALFYLDALPTAGELVTVDGDEGFHAANVRRIRPGERLDVSDGAGTVAGCVVEQVAKGWLTARVTDVRIVALTAPQVTVVQALPK